MPDRHLLHGVGQRPERAFPFYSSAAVGKDVVVVGCRDRRIYGLDINTGKPRWSFLDGPITANNPMGVHHAWGRTLKDAFQRFFAMSEAIAHLNHLWHAGRLARIIGSNGTIRFGRP